jgi:hypothetical protein
MDFEKENNNKKIWSFKKCNFPEHWRAFQEGAILVMTYL